MSLPLILLFIVAAWFAIGIGAGMVFGTAAHRNEEPEPDGPSEWTAHHTAREQRISRATLRANEQATARQLLNEERAAAERNFPAA